MTANQGKTSSSATARSQFEAWLLDTMMLTAVWDESRNCYEEFRAHLAWKAWQAASTRSETATKEPLFHVLPTAEGKAWPVPHLDKDCPHCAASVDSYKWVKAHENTAAPLSASAEPTPFFPQPEALMHFLQAAGRGEITGHVESWPQFQLACRWAAEQIEASRSAIGEQEAVRLLRIAFSEGMDDYWMTTATGKEWRKRCVAVLDRRNDDDPDA
jgi:hypothetical protein